MKMNFQPKDPFHLTDDEIDQLQIHSGTYDKNANEETKQEWRVRYRKVESETNRIIAKYDSVEKWYESGEDRVL